MAPLLAVGLTTAQPLSPPGSESKPPIELKLSATSLMMCVGSSLPLELELTNRGAQDFSVDKFDIWNQFNYAFLGEREAGRGGGMGSSCYDCRPDLIVVGQDQMYKSSFNFDLKRDFFQDAGKYHIKLTIAAVASNQVEFELFSCQ